MSSIIVTVQSPNAVIREQAYTASTVVTGGGPYQFDGVTASNPTPNYQSISIPFKSTSVLFLNRGTSTIDYGFDVAPTTPLTAGTSIAISLSATNKILSIQGSNLLVDCIFAVTDI